MTIPEITQEITIPPAPPTGIYDADFQNKVNNLLAWYNTHAIEETTFIEQLNLLVAGINAEIPNIEAVAQMPVMADFLGEWNSSITANKGQSVSVGDVLYVSKINNNNEEPPSANWIEFSKYKTGEIITYTKDTPPVGFLECNGAELSRETYSRLFSVIGTTFGSGDGSTTFNIPDLRGEFIRGWDNGRGVDSNRVFGSNQLDAIRNITGNIRFGGGTEPKFAAASGAFFPTERVNYYSQTTDTSGYARYNAVEFDTSRVVPTAPENRPKNIALMFCIKY